MTQAFPLSLAEFAHLLPIKTFAWRLQMQQEISGLGGGEIIVADGAPPYWTSKVGLDSMPHDEAGEIQSIVDALSTPLMPFYFHDPRSPYPKADPNGALLGASTVRIAEVRNNNKEIKLKGLPGLYTLSRRDWFSFDFGASPVHRAYHRVLTPTVTADAFGNTGWIEFRPFLLAVPPVDTVVTLANAAAQCVIVPKSFNEGQPAGTRNYGMSFEIRQVL